VVDLGQVVDGQVGEPAGRAHARAGVAGVRALAIEQPFEVDRGRCGQQLRLHEPGAAASRASGAMALELCDRAFGVGLAIDGGVTEARRAHGQPRRLRVVRRVAINAVVPSRSSVL
jgi:hypothetical protein